MRSLYRRSRKHQQGVAAVFAALCLVAMISALALAVDTGRLYVAQRDLQRLADLAAIDAARVASGCFAGAGTRAQAPDEAKASLARNGKPADATDLTRVGRRSNSNGTLSFEPVADNQSWDSVQVQLTRPSPARILPLFSGADTRTLHAQAAAFAGVTSSFGPASTLPLATDGRLLAGTLAPQLGGAATDLVLDLAGLRATANASVRVGDLIDASLGTGADGSELDQPQTVRGMLTRLEELLRATGDTASATVVQSFANATAAGSTLIPGQVLGIPTGTPRALYENAVVGADSVLSAVTSTLGQGLAVTTTVQLPPPVCALTAPLGICDVQVTSRVSTPGTPGVVTSGLDTRATGTDSAASVGGAVELRIKLTVPGRTETLELPLVIRQEPIGAKLSSLACARRGFSLAEAHLLTHGGGVAVGFSSSQDLSLPLAAGIGIPILNLNLLGQSLRVSMQSTPVQVDGGETDLCFNGPPWPTTVQCDGTPAESGRAQAADLAAAIAGLPVTLTVESLPNGPLGAAVNAALAPILASLNALLPGLLSALSGQVLPLLANVNLPAGRTLWRFYSLTADPPTVYAR